VRHERGERAVPAFSLVEGRAEVGGTLLQDRPDQLLVGDQAGLEQVITQFLVAGPVQVVGQQVVADHGFARYAKNSQHDRGHPAAAVLAAGAVIQRGQRAGTAQQPQRGAEHLPLPRISHEPPVDVHHQRGGAAIAEFAPLPGVVRAGDDFVHPGQIPAGHRHGYRCHAARQPVLAADQYLARRAEVDDGAQVQRGDGSQIRVGQRGQRVPPVQAAAGHGSRVAGPVPADVAHVDRAVQFNPPGRGEVAGHRDKAIAHHLLGPGTASVRSGVLPCQG